MISITLKCSCIVFFNFSTIRCVLKSLVVTCVRSNLNCYVHVAESISPKQKLLFVLNQNTIAILLAPDSRLVRKCQKKVLLLQLLFTDQTLSLSKVI